MLSFGLNLTSLFAQEPHLSSAASDDCVHPAKSVNAQKSWDVRASDNSGPVCTQMVVVVCVLHSNRHNNAFARNLCAFSDTVDCARFGKLKELCLVSTGLCPSGCMDSPAFTAQAILRPGVREQHWLAFWIIFPCIIMLSQMLSPDALLILCFLLLLPLRRQPELGQLS